MLRELSPQDALLFQVMPRRGTYAILSRDEELLVTGRGLRGHLTFFEVHAKEIDFECDTANLRRLGLIDVSRNAALVSALDTHFAAERPGYFHANDLVFITTFGRRFQQCCVPERNWKLTPHTALEYKFDRTHLHP